MLYLLAAETGLRSGELRSLTRASFSLDSKPATVTVAAAYSKHRRDDTLPLRPELGPGPGCLLEHQGPCYAGVQDAEAGVRRRDVQGRPGCGRDHPGGRCGQTGGLPRPAAYVHLEPGQRRRPSQGRPGPCPAFGHQPDHEPVYPHLPGRRDGSPANLARSDQGSATGGSPAGGVTAGRPASKNLAFCLAQLGRSVASQVGAGRPSMAGGPTAARLAPNAANRQFLSTSTGEGGIRTHEAGHPAYRFSKPAPSTAQTPLQHIVQQSLMLNLAVASKSDRTASTTAIVAGHSQTPVGCAAAEALHQPLLRPSRRAKPMSHATGKVGTGQGIRPVPRARTCNSQPSRTVAQEDRRRDLLLRFGGDPRERGHVCGIGWHQARSAPKPAATCGRRCPRTDVLVDGLSCSHLGSRDGCRHNMEGAPTPWSAPADGASRGCQPRP